MKNTKSKLVCYVLMIAEYFPAYHPRKNDKTFFHLGLISQRKKHTIRSNFEYWKKRIDKINEGKAYLSLRQWYTEEERKAKPYNDSQISLLRKDKADNIGYQHIQIMNDGSFWIDKRKINLAEEIQLATNDGLLIKDFYKWFKLKNVLKCKEKIFFDGIIIHFTDFRY